MSRFHKLSSNFASGEFSPTAMGRVDSKEYEAGAQLMSNWIPKKNYASKRPGTRFANALTGMFRPGLLPFIQAADSGFVVALDPSKVNGGGDFIRVFRDDGLIQTVDATLFTTLITNYTDTAALVAIDPMKFVFAQIADVLFITHASGRLPPFKVYLKDGVFFVEVYVAIDITDPLLDISEALKVPYINTNTSQMTMISNVISGNGFLTASSAYFTPGHLGTIFKLTHGGLITGVAKVSAYINPVDVAISTIVDFSATTATTNWEESAWNDEYGWPKAVCSYEQRLVWGGTFKQPDTLWGSLTGNVFHMMGRKLVQDQDSLTDVSGINYFGENVPTDPYSFGLSATEVNKITWLAANSNINVGTLSTEYIGNGGQSILSGDSVNFRPQTNYGSSENKVLMLGNEIVFISRDGRKLRNFKFSDNNGSNISNDLSFFADHMSKIGGTEKGFIDIAFEKSSDVIWLINANFQLISFTYQLDNPTVAWARHTIAGAVAIRGITAIPTVGGVDNLYMVVERVINGVTVYYLEHLPDNADEDSLNTTSLILEDQSTYVDSAQTIISPFGGIQIITALNRLEGEELTVTINGKLHGLFTVAAGQIDLGVVVPEDDMIILGLAYRGDLVKLPLKSGGDFGVGIANIKRIDTAHIRFYKTYDAKVTTYGATYFQDVGFGDDLFTGIKTVPVDADPERDQALHIFSDQPYPCNVLLVTQRGRADD